MKQAYKIEMYDAGVVLHNSTLYNDVEYFGWDYSEDAGRYQLTLFGLSLFHETGGISEETYRRLEEKDDLSIASKSLSRHVWCITLEADELPTGVLRIRATPTHSHADINRADDGWHVSATYKGSYTVFWVEEE